MKSPLKVLLALCTGILFAIPAKSQTKLGNNPGTIDPAAILELENPNKALYLTRVSLTTTSDITTVPNPKAGMIVFNTNSAIYAINSTFTASGVGIYYYDGTGWVYSGIGTFANFYWSLNGNANAVDGTNFLGTTNNVALNFRVNNMKSGRIDLQGNTSLGYQAAANQALGQLNNTFIGSSSGNGVTTGFSNTGIGTGSLLNIGLGYNNVAVGNQAGATFANGHDNTFLGNGTDVTLQTINNATAIGSGAQVSQSNSMVLGNSNVNVGIGNTAPSNKLHITGTNPLRLDGLQGIGTSDSVLTTDATGVVKKVSTAAVITNIKANNGLTRVADSIQLGGTLTKATAINQNGNALSLTNGTVSIGGNTTITGNIRTNGNDTTTGANVAGNFVTTGNTRTGTLTATNLGTGNTPDSLLNINNGVVSKISPAAIIGNIKANNGLTRNNDSVQLGGALTMPTTVTQNGNALNFTGGTVTIGGNTTVNGNIRNNGSDTTTGNTTTNTLAVVNGTTIGGNALINGNVRTNGNDTTIGGNVAGNFVTAGNTRTGTLTATNLGTGNAPDSLLNINNGVVSKIAPSAITNNIKANNGLTRNNDSVQLGGTLTMPTTIAQNGNALNFNGGTVTIGGNTTVNGNIRNNGSDTTTGNTTTNTLAVMNAAVIGGTTTIGGNTTINANLRVNGNDTSSGAKVAGNFATTGNTRTGTLTATNLGNGNAPDSLLNINNGVVSKISPSAITNNIKANNGLTRNNDSVQLGGTLTMPTTIAQNGNALNFNGGNVTIGGNTTVNGNIRNNGSDTTTGNTTTGTLAVMGNTTVGGNATVTGTTTSGNFITAGNTRTSTLTATGLTAGNPTDSILNVNAATGVVSKVSPSSIIGNIKANNGLTRNNDSIQLGGTLTMPTTVYSDANNTLTLRPTGIGGTTNDANQGLTVLSTSGNAATAIGVRSNAQVTPGTTVGQLRAVNGTANVYGTLTGTATGGYLNTVIRPGSDVSGAGTITGASGDVEVLSGTTNITNANTLSGARFGADAANATAARTTGVTATAGNSLSSNVGVAAGANVSEQQLKTSIAGQPAGFNTGVYGYNNSNAANNYAAYFFGNAVTTGNTRTSTLTATGLGNGNAPDSILNINNGVVSKISPSAIIANVRADNGLTRVGDSIELGGTLKMPTIVNQANNNLAFTNGTVSIGGNTTITGNTTVNGNIRNNGSDTTTGNTTTGTLAVMGNTTVGGNATVTGTTTSGNFITAGNTRTSTLTATGLTAGNPADSILNVNAATGVVSKVSPSAIIGNIKANNGLTRNNDSIQLGGTLTMPTNIAQNGNALNFNGGAVTIGGNTTITGNTRINGNDTTTGATSTNTLAVTNTAAIGGNTTVGGTATIAGTTTIGGNTTINANLRTNGNDTTTGANVAGNFATTGNTRTGTLTATGLGNGNAPDSLLNINNGVVSKISPAAIIANVRADNGLTRVGDSIELGGTLKMPTTVNQAGNALNFNGGAVTIGGNTTITGNTRINGNDTTTGNTTTSTLAVMNNTTVGGTATIAGTTTIGGNTTINANLRTNGNDTTTGANVAGNFATTGNTRTSTLTATGLGNGNAPDSLLNINNGVVSKISPAAIIAGIRADNGLTRVGDSIELGGTLKMPTTVNQAGNALNFNGGTVNIGGNTTVTGNVRTNGNDTTTGANTAGNFYTTGNTTTSSLTATGINAGAATDSVLTINPVTNVVRKVNINTLGAVTTASNGIVKVGNDVQLGGALTQNTTIASNGFNITLNGLGGLNVNSLLNAGTLAVSNGASVGQNLIVTGTTNSGNFSTIGTTTTAALTATSIFTGSPSNDLLNITPSGIVQRTSPASIIANIKADNGLTRVGDSIELGGTLKMPTTVNQAGNALNFNGGAVTIGGNTTITGNTRINGNDTTTGATSTNTLAVTNGTAIGGNALVNGNVRTNGNDTTVGANVAGNFATTGNTRTGTLTATNLGTGSAPDSLLNINNGVVSKISPAAIIAGIRADNGLTRVGDSIELGGTLKMPTTVNQAGNALNFNGGAVTIGGNTTITGNTRVNGNDTTTGNTTTSTLAVLNNATVGGTATITGTTTIGGNTTINANLRTNGNDTTTGANVAGNFATTGNTRTGTLTATNLGSGNAPDSLLNINNGVVSKISPAAIIANIKADNGLTRVGDSIELGGTLKMPTTVNQAGNALNFNGGTVTIGGNTTVNGNIRNNGNDTTTGNTTTSTLAVMNNTTIGGTTTIGGNTTINANLRTNGNDTTTGANVAGNFATTGNTRTGTLTATNLGNGNAPDSLLNINNGVVSKISPAAIIAGIRADNGLTRVGDSIELGGTLKMPTTVNQAGNALNFNGGTVNIGGNTTITGNTRINGNDTTTGATSTNTLAVTNTAAIGGNTTVGGTATIAGTTTIGGNTTINANLRTNGNDTTTGANVAGNFATTGNTRTSTLTATGLGNGNAPDSLLNINNGVVSKISPAAIIAGIRADNGLTRVGDSIELGGTLKMPTTVNQAGNALNFNGGTVNIGGNTTITGNTRINGNDTTTGATSTNTLAVTNGTTIGGNALVNGNLRVNGNDTTIGANTAGSYATTGNTRTGTLTATNLGNGNAPDSLLNINNGVVSKISPAAIIANIKANNGLTRNNDSIQLGGTLTMPTNINQNGNNFSVTNGNVGFGTTTPANNTEFNYNNVGGGTTGESQQGVNVLTTNSATAPLAIGLRSRMTVTNTAAEVRASSSALNVNNSVSGAASAGYFNASLRAGGSLGAGVNLTAVAADAVMSGGTANNATAVIGGRFNGNASSTATRSVGVLAIAEGSTTLNVGLIGSTTSNALTIAGSIPAGTNAAILGVSGTQTATDYAGYFSGSVVATGNVGVGINTPSNALHVNGTNPLRLQGLQPVAATDSVLTKDATGVVKTASTAAVIANIKANNGLTRNNDSVQLGGTLTMPTTIAQNGNALNFNGGAVTIGGNTTVTGNVRTNGNDTTTGANVAGNFATTGNTRTGTLTATNLGNGNAPDSLLNINNGIVSKISPAAIIAGIRADNGLTRVGDSIELGGTLKMPTTVNQAGNALNFNGGAVTIGGNTTITGNTRINGNDTTTGATSTNTLAVTNTAAIGGNTTVGGTATIAGTTTIGGNTTINANLRTNGNDTTTGANVAGNFATTGNTRTSTLTATGLGNGNAPDSLLNINNGVVSKISPAAIIAGIRADNGLTRVGDSIELGGTLKMPTTVNQAGNALNFNGGTVNIGGNTTITGNTRINGNDTTTGATSTNTLAVTNTAAIGGNTTVGGTATIAGTTTIGGNTTINANLRTNGNDTTTGANVAGNFATTGNTRTGTLTATNLGNGNAPDSLLNINNGVVSKISPAAIIANVRADNGLTRVGDSIELGGTLKMPTTVNQAGNALNFNGGAVTIGGNTTITGNTRINGNDTTTGNTTTSTLAVMNNTTVGGTATIAGTTTIGGNTTINANLRTNGNDTTTGANVAGNFATTGNTRTGTLTATNLGNGNAPDSLLDINNGVVSKISTAAILAGIRADNGLTRVGDSIELGGTLKMPTTVNQAGNALNFNGGAVTIGGNTTVTGNVRTNGNDTTTGANTAGNFYTTGNSTTNTLTATGLASGAATDSIVTVGATGIVNKRNLNSVVTASNGLTATNGNVTLGGSLTNNTFIVTNGNNITLQGPGALNVGGNVSGQDFNANGNTTTQGNTQTNNINVLNNTSTFSLKATGLSAGSATDSIVTVDASGVVHKRNVASVVTASNGLTATNGNVTLGGTLTGATTVNQNSNNLAFTNGTVSIGGNTTITGNESVSGTTTTNALTITGLTTGNATDSILTTGPAGVTRRISTAALLGNIVTNASLTGNGTASAPLAINPANANTFSAAQTFNGGAVITGGSITGSAITTGSINNTPIGAGTASTGNFTSLTASGATVNGNATVTGNTTTATLTATGNTTVGGTLGVTGNTTVTSLTATGLTSGSANDSILTIDPVTNAVHRTDIGVINGNDWHTTGNAGTTTANFLGTTDAQQFAIRTANTQRALFRADGSIAMGNNVAIYPDNKFEIDLQNVGGTQINGEQNQGFNVLGSALNGSALSIAVRGRMDVPTGSTVGGVRGIQANANVSGTVTGGLTGGFFDAALKSGSISANQAITGVGADAEATGTNTIATTNTFIGGRFGASALNATAGRTIGSLSYGNSSATSNVGSFSLSNDPSFATFTALVASFPAGFSSAAISANGDTAANHYALYTQGRVRLTNISGGSNVDSLVTIDPSGVLHRINFQAAGSAITANNGLTKTGNNIQLGGTLVMPTTIDQANNALTFNNALTRFNSIVNSDTAIVLNVSSTNNSDNAKAMSVSLMPAANSLSANFNYLAATRSSISYNGTESTGSIISTLSGAHDSSATTSSNYQAQGAYMEATSSNGGGGIFHAVGGYALGIASGIATDTTSTVQGLSGGAVINNAGSNWNGVGVDGFVKLSNPTTGRLAGGHFDGTSFGAGSEFGVIGTIENEGVTYPEQYTTFFDPSLAGMHIAMAATNYNAPAANQLALFTDGAVQMHNLAAAGTGSSTNPLTIDPVSGNVSVGNAVLSMGHILTFAATPANSSNDQTISVLGAVEGDVIALGVPNAAVLPNSCYTAWVSANDTVTVRFNNYQSDGATPGSGTQTPPANLTFKVKILQ